MVNVFIVEDELSALDRISSFRIWTGGKYRLAGTARNGLAAIEKLSRLRVDVIITDIEMPVMNGIELIRQLREDDICTPVIILSCHESFEYARRAVSLGVREYLLKDFMEEDAIRLALSKMTDSSAEVRSEEYTIPPAGADDRGQALMRAVGRGGLLSDIFSDKEGRASALVLIHIDGFSLSRHEPAKFIEEIRYDLAAVEAGGKLCSACYSDSGDFWVLLEGEALAFAEGFYSRMAANNISVTIAAGETFGAENDLKTEAASVREIFGYRLFLGKNRIILSETVRSIGGKNPSYIRKKIEMIKSAIHEGDSGGCFILLRELYDRDLPGMLKYNYLEWVNLRLLSIILASEERGEINLREITGQEFLSIKDLESKETVSEMRQWFENIFSRIFKIEDEDPSPRVANRNIQRVINIIKTRYDEDLSLEDLADEIGVHKVYLSRLFKKEAGRTYYDFLQNYRIRKATLLLKEENLKIYEIAQRTGFKNYDQFAVVFKKLKGVSPSEYRHNMFS
ncbi:MAG: response regulator [Spirochaetales bacterium]|nr:response regulator [Spirochaetales bacterium]